jgi:lipid-binding SYLF domain-containing protein/predicted outer membrane protein
MNTRTLSISIFAALLSAPLHAATSPMEHPGDAQMNMNNTPATRSDGDQRNDARQEVGEAIKVVQKMNTDPELKKLLTQAKGIFIVPDFARAGLIIGGSGGSGVLLAHSTGAWSNPAFYNMGAVSFGAQAGGSAGQIAMVLMTDKALHQFERNNTFSLNADAGLNIVNWSARAQGSWGKGDIVMWSDAEGAYAGATVSASDINFDEAETRAYYGRPVAATDVLNGKVASGPADAQQLRQTLAGSKVAAVQRSSSKAPAAAKADQDFVKAAAQSGMAEVEASKLALKKSQDADVRNFAQRMVDDHTKANDKLKVIARSNNLSIPDQSSNEQQNKIESLGKVAGDTFDQRYMDFFGVPAHERAINLFEREAKSGADADLRDFAQNTLPTLREHLKMARDVSAQMSASEDRSHTAQNR